MKKSGWQNQRKVSTKVNILGRNPGPGKDALGRVTAVHGKKQV